MGQQIQESWRMSLNMMLRFDQVCSCFDFENEDDIKQKFLLLHSKPEPALQLRV